MNDEEQTFQRLLFCLEDGKEVCHLYQEELSEAVAAYERGDFAAVHSVLDALLQKVVSS